VLTIIALLMGMVIFKVRDLTSGAKPEKVQADLLTFKEMLASYELDNSTLPTTDQGLKSLWEKPTIEPVPPRWHAELDSAVLDPWGHPYQYRNPGKHNPDKYDVFSMGEDGLPDTDDDIGNWNNPTATASQ
jgi:general secretion pathway protein G